MGRSLQNTKAQLRWAQVNNLHERALKALRRSKSTGRPNTRRFPTSWRRGQTRWRRSSRGTRESAGLIYRGVGAEVEPRRARESRSWWCSCASPGVRRQYRRLARDRGPAETRRPPAAPTEGHRLRLLVPADARFSLLFGRSCSESCSDVQMTCDLPPLRSDRPRQLSRQQISRRIDVGRRLDRHARATT